MPMRESTSRPLPLDQADGLRRMFARPRVRFIPIVSNPHVAFGGVLLERLCTAFAAHGRRTLVVDASERAAEPNSLAPIDLAGCIETLSPTVSYLAARGLPLRHVDTTGSTAGFLAAVADAAPHADVVLVHAPASDLCRLFGRHRDIHPVRPLLLADDRPASVTHAYAALKLLTQRGGLMVHDLLLGAAPHSPRAERIAQQIASCADSFLGALLRDWAQVDPASDAAEPPTPALARLAAELLQPAEAPPDSASLPFYVDRPPQSPARARAMN